MIHMHSHNHVDIYIHNHNKIISLVVLSLAASTKLLYTEPG